jgi:pimeloyl-ACP methyl ester carboxylesterase
MELFYRKSGHGEPLVILHGLYGSSDNWHSIARELADKHTVYLIDQRNHGHSPHHPEHNYDLLVSDLEEFMLRHHLTRSVILGHSMGGKAALAFSVNNPEKVSKLIVVDISPLGYNSSSNAPERSIHERIIRALLAVDPLQIKTRNEADAILQKTIALPAIRQFLLKNLKRDGEGKFYWGLNIKGLSDNLQSIFAGVVPETASQLSAAANLPALFIKGAYSGYIRNHDEAAIRQYFPNARLITIQGAGHWTHADQPQAFIRTVREFLHADENETLQ